MSAALLLPLLMFGCSGPPSAPELIASPFTDWTDVVTSQIRAGALANADVREGGFWYLKQEGCGPIMLETGTCFGAHPASPSEPHQPLSAIEIWPPMVSI